MIKHHLVYKKIGWYSAFPQLYQAENDRLVIGIPSSPFTDHFHVDIKSRFIVLESTDLGTSWLPTNDPSIPFNWPGSNPRECYDRFANIMSDGSYLCAGSVGWEIWPLDRKQEALDQKLNIRPHQNDSNSIVVGGHKIFVQRSTDSGKSWSRQESHIPGFSMFQTYQVPQYTSLLDGTVLFACYGTDIETGQYASYVWRSTDLGKSFRLIPMGSHSDGVHPGETALMETLPNHLLALSRTEPDPGYMVQRWSDDGGLSWSYPLRVGFWGFPGHLLKLSDGRILCSYGYRREPMGIRAVLSMDGGQSWDIDNTIILRSGGGTPNQMRKDKKSGEGDIGYPVSTQIKDGRIFTTYYITQPDGITHVECCLWEI